MRYLCDADSNSLVVTFTEGRTYRDSAEIADGVVVDFDTDGRPFAIEFLRADQSVDVTGLISGRSVPFQDEIPAPIVAGGSRR